MRIKVFVISYERELREIIRRGIVGNGIEIVPSYNIIEAAKEFKKNEPNILILDLDGVGNTPKFIKMLMQKYELFIILISNQTRKSFEYLNIGLKEFIIKPDIYNSKYGNEFVRGIGERIKEYIKNNKFKVQGSFDRSSSMQNRMSFRETTLAVSCSKVIAIASSTGGTEALSAILPKLPENMPPILIVQHMLTNFIKQFAQRLDNFCALNIKQAEDFEYIKPGRVYIAPGDIHMIINKRAGAYNIELVDGNKVNGVKPAADVLFDSIANVVKENAIGVILTGMGGDGAKGLYNMRINGAKTVGQDEKTSIIYGMPKVAFQLGAVERQLPLDSIAEYLKGFAI